jgi:hypothetical protein
MRVFGALAAARLGITFLIGQPFKKVVQGLLTSKFGRPLRMKVPAVEIDPKFGYAPNLPRP